MRHIGKTTRLIDEAVQYLFTEGEIKLFTNSEIEQIHENGLPLRGLSPRNHAYMKFIDPDHFPDNKAQAYFIGRFRQRLSYEHRGRYEEINKNHFKLI